MYSKKSISVTIPNYNGKELLEKNLPFLYQALEKVTNNYEIIVADDASTDHSISFLKENYPHIKVIEHASNQGFSKNINSAIRKASKDLVFLLNTDVKLTDDYFEHLLPYFDSPDTFGVMGMVIGIGEGEIQDAAKYPTIGKISIRANINFIPTERTKKKTPSLFLSGGWSLVDRIKLEELGGFDEIYSPFYGEDVDLSLRAWKVGYHCYFEPKAICRHPSSSTIKKFKKSRVQVVAKRNKMLLHFIHLNGFNLGVYLILLTVKVPFRLLILDFNYVKAFIQFLEKLPKAKGSKQALLHLQESRNTAFTMKDVKNEIMRNISQFLIRKF